MNSTQYLDKLNQEYARLHEKYENYFWISYMGDHSVDKKMNEAMAARDAFKTNRAYAKQIDEYLKDKKASANTIERLKIWQNFFAIYQVPEELVSLREQIQKLETKIQAKRAKRLEGYTDPKTKKFVKASENKLRMMMVTDNDEKMRKAAFDAMEKLAHSFLNEYVKLVSLLNQYGRKLGFDDFYSYKLSIDEGMTKKELFGLWDQIYNKTKYAFKDIRKLEKKMPGLRKPWNFSYMMAGDFMKEEDPYYQFDEALIRWGRSFQALGIDYQGGDLTLDLLDRAGKWNNGFCHWPRIVQFKNGKRIPASSGFTCTVVAGQVGSGHRGMETLFHEGGHAAHYSNTEQREVILNTEYPPASTAWAETHSMFCDTMFSSIEWRTRYAKNAQGHAYPFDLFERKVRKLSVLAPLDLSSIMCVSEFEKEIYEEKNLTKEKVLRIARSVVAKHSDLGENSLRLLNVPHIYGWESICAYHGYGLAELALAQWREYFYKKYGYIVDNPKVGKEMKKVWALGSNGTYKKFLKIATGKNISASDYVNNITRGVERTLALGKKRIAAMKNVPEQRGPVKLNATIRMTHGKKEIANNKKSFEDMASRYGKWLSSQPR